MFQAPAVDPNEERTKVLIYQSSVNSKTTMELFFGVPGMSQVSIASYSSVNV